MEKYRVIRPWFGVSMGQIVTLKEVHPALRPNVVPVGEGELKESDAASKVLEQARTEAKTIVDEATAKAQQIVDDAQKRAADILPMVQGDGPELSPATPAATADKSKATTKPK